MVLGRGQQNLCAAVHHIVDEDQQYGRHTFSAALSKGSTSRLLLRPASIPTTGYTQQDIGINVLQGGLMVDASVTNLARLCE